MRYLNIPLLAPTRIVPCFLLFMAFLLFSCTVQKRVYRTGLYVHHSRQKPVSKFAHAVSGLTKSSVNGENEHLNDNFQPDDKSLSAGVGPAYSLINSLGRLPTVVKENTCDSIFLKNGKVLAARVIEIGTREIKYKLCDFEDGPNYVVEKTKVDFILYSNGRNEKIVNEPRSVSEEPSTGIYNPQPAYVQQPKVNNTTANLSVVFSSLGIYPLIIIGSVVGLILGFVAQEEIRREPEKYTNPKSAKIGIGLGVGGLIFWIGIILLIVLFA